MRSSSSFYTLKVKAVGKAARPMNSRRYNAGKHKQQQLPGVDVLVDDREQVNTPWRVLLYNDDIHTFDEVITQLTKALQCPSDYAKEITVKVHNEGKALVYEGDFEPCFEINSVLKEIQLITEIKG